VAALRSTNGPRGTRRARHAHSASNFQRFKQLHEVNRRLTTFADDQEQSASEELAEIRRHLAADAILQDREYSFCLYPAAKLGRLMASLWPGETNGEPA
jgi:hypothetical protein